MVQTYKKYGVTTGGYRGERAILKERVIEGLTQAEFTDEILQLTADSQQTIVLNSSNMAEGYFIALPNATTLWLNWKVTIINESAITCPIYYYTSDYSQLNLFKEVTGGNMTTCILLDNTTSEGNWTTLRTVEQTSADLLERYTSNVFEPLEISWNQINQAHSESDESEETIIKFSLGEVLAGTSIRSVYAKTLEQFTFDEDSDEEVSLSLCVGTNTDDVHFINSYVLTNSVEDNNFTKDYFEEILSTDTNQEIFAYFKGINLDKLNAGKVRIVVEKAKLIDPTILKNPIVQTQVPLGVIMSYPFIDADGKVPEGYWRLDGSMFPNASTAIPQFVEKLTTTNNRLPGPEKLLVGSDEWHQIESTYGSCGKFCWEGSSLRFPKINNFIQGLSDLTQLGKLVEASNLNTPHFHVAGGYNWGNNNGWFTTTSQWATASMPPGGGTTGWNGSGGGGGHSGASSVTGNQITSYQVQNGVATKVQPESIKYPYIISIYNKIQSSAALDLDAIIEASVNKANVSLNNITTIDSSFISKLSDLGIRFVTETYTSGSYWYRKYNDGWVEQSGRGPSAGIGFTTVTLLVPMRDTNYTLLYNNNRGSSAADMRNAMIISSTQISVGSDGAYPIWYVCGLGAE